MLNKTNQSRIASLYHKYHSMKHLLLFLLLIPGMSAWAQNAEITFTSTETNLGKLKQNNPKEVIFTFTNTGDANLIITAVSPSCGCTTGDFTKTPIAPGKEGYIKLVFNAAATGPFTKSATVNSNAKNGQTLLYFKGEVMP